LLGKVYLNDCFNVFPKILDKSIDLILSDLPYGITANKWDIPLDLEKLWIQYKRILKTPGTVVLTACQPFTTDLINSNRKWFKYEMILQKESTGFLNSNRRPLVAHENILIFAKKEKYNPQKHKGRISHGSKTTIFKNNNYGNFQKLPFKKTTDKFPISIIKFNKNRSLLHPTEKPVKLFEYLIKTYSDENDTILDNCAGSGTTGVACMRTNRKYILIEKEKEYYDIILKRLVEEKDKTALFNDIPKTEQLNLL
jgi:site-specific DNA-methyltransferase (adenine-specific)